MSEALLVWRWWGRRRAAHFMLTETKDDPVRGCMSEARLTEMAETTSNN